MASLFNTYAPNFEITVGVYCVGILRTPSESSYSIRAIEYVITTPGLSATKCSCRSRPNAPPAAAPKASRHPSKDSHVMYREALEHPASRLEALSYISLPPLARLSAVRSSCSAEPIPIRQPTYFSGFSFHWLTFSTKPLASVLAIDNRFLIMSNVYAVQVYGYLD